MIDAIYAGVAIGAVKEARLKSAEHKFILNKLAGLCRTVHSDRTISILLKRIKHETAVAFLPESKAGLTLFWEKKMIGVKQKERLLKRRRAKPSFAATTARTPHTAAATIRTRIVAGGKIGPKCYFSA